jgi:hypothetical protein
MSIKALKKTISAQRYVENLVRIILNMPHRALRAAREDIDFSNHWHVRRYKASVEPTIWASVQSAFHLVQICLVLPRLIDDETAEKIWSRLIKSAEVLTRDALSKTYSEEDDEQDDLPRKPPCDICHKPGGWQKVKDHRVCPRCLEEIEQIVFARATDTNEPEKCFCVTKMGLLKNQIIKLDDYMQTGLIVDFLNLMITEPSSLDLDLKKQLSELKRIANQHLQKL